MIDDRFPGIGLGAWISCRLERVLGSRPRGFKSPILRGYGIGLDLRNQVKTDSV